MLMSWLHSPLMLLGLVVVLIPPLIHLLNRRRYDVVDWGAMQFLLISDVTRRKLMIEELLLMLLRMGLLGVLVLALAGPFLDTRLPPRLGFRSNRDMVLVIDGSASMAATGTDGSASPAEKAREWALDYLDTLQTGDTVALLLAREQVVSLQGSLSNDRQRLRKLIEELPAPAGGAAWPEAVKRAATILADGQHATREVILLTDNQKHSWADPETLFRWELLAGELGLNRPPGTGDAPRPAVRVVNVAGERAARPPNVALAPLRGNRPVVPVDRPVTFATELVLFGQPGYSPPHRIRLDVDGKFVRNLAPPRGVKLDNGRVPFSFTHRFGKPGSHLVSLTVEPDPPPAERPRGYRVKDRVPGDNRQDFAVEVLQALSVLLVDGDTSPVPPRERGTDFLRDALAPARDRHPA